MPNGHERPTRLEKPTPQLIEESRRPADNVPELPPNLSPETYAAPNAEAPFRLEVVRLVRELENEIHQLSSDQMDADEKAQLFPLLWEMTRDENIAELVLTTALIFGEPQFQRRGGRDWLVKRLRQIKLPVLLGYIREATPILGIKVPGLEEKEKMDELSTDQAVQESLLTPTISEAKFKQMLEHSRKMFKK